MPINFGGVIAKLMKKVDISETKLLDNLNLSDHTSKWNMDLYLAVDKEVPGAENVTLSGKFYQKSMKVISKTPANGERILINMLKAKISRSRNGICGTPPAPNAPRNTARTMWL